MDGWMDGQTDGRIDSLYFKTMNIKAKKLVGSFVLKN